MQSSSRLVGEFLVERKVLSRDALEENLRREAETGVPLAKLLASEGLVGERDLVAAVADQMRMPFWDPGTMLIPAMIEGIVPSELARRYQAVAVATKGDELLVAMENPTDEEAIRQLSVATGWKIRPALAARRDLIGAINSIYGQPESRSASTEGPSEDEPREMHINQFLTQLVERRGSDLHLTAGLPPCIRVDGALQSLPGYEALNGSQLRQLIFAILTQRQREKFEANRELDTSHVVPNVGRFRVNVFLQRDSVGAVLRSIPFEIKPLERLGIPQAVKQFAELPRGMVLVTGPTGSGKSTTLAGVIDIVNSTKPCHIMTVEDPIEFLHQHKRAIVNQREVGEDTKSFSDALKHVLRQDPDVILVGELRDLETISTALTAAETGHLVFATLHTQDAPQSIDRVIDVFPAHQQQQIRIQLASTLQGVVTQQLLPRTGGQGRVVATEILVATPGIRNLIREGKTHQMHSAMQAGAKYGMRTMDQSLAELVKAGIVSTSVAEERCANVEDFRRLLSAA
jgi:twitching motility protein PilT